MIDDKDAVHLFLCFYKLLFLGTEFAHKMLKIKLADKQYGNAEHQLVIEDHKGNTTDEEGNQTLSDLSDVITSDFGADDYKIHSGSINSTDYEQDPYNKIKLHASLSLRNLFKNNSKMLYNYWYLLFPSFMMRPLPEF